MYIYIFYSVLDSHQHLIRYFAILKQICHYLVYVNIGLFYNEYFFLRGLFGSLSSVTSKNSKKQCKRDSVLHP